jgi:hypothetical protein
VRKLIVIFFYFLFVSLSFSQTKGELPCISKTFQVAVHVVKDEFGNKNINMTDIYSYFDQLNIYFEPICISFNICDTLTIDNFAFDTITKDVHDAYMQSLYNLNNRINVYYVTNIIGTNINGFATLGGIKNFNLGGIVIEKISTALTLAHEMGHYFGLKHTFEGSGTELVNGSNCNIAGDEICDTPADPYNENEDPFAYVDATCTFISLKQDLNDHFYNPHVSNIMSYYLHCDCGNFTHGQYMKMAQTYLGGVGMW